jgi:8-oxo-dGTP pyrophosphatase MutT (NUDIX family)
MSATTATSGSVVCPGGIPDLDDISEDRIVDLDGSVVRETLEETGLDISQYINKSWLVIEGDGNKVILGKIVSIDKPSKDILSLANHNTEFESTYFTDKIDPNTPRYIKTALGAVL